MALCEVSGVGREDPSDNLLGSPHWDSRACQTLPGSALELRACASYLEVGNPSTLPHLPEHRNLSLHQLRPVLDSSDPRPARHPSGNFFIFILEIISSLLLHSYKKFDIWGLVKESHTILERKL